MAKKKSLKQLDNAAALSLSVPILFKGEELLSWARSLFTEQSPTVEVLGPLNVKLCFLLLRLIFEGSEKKTLIAEYHKERFGKEFDNLPEALILGDVAALEQILLNNPALKRGVESMINEIETAVANVKQHLQHTYNVVVETVDTDADFYSEASFQRILNKNVYLISKENPTKTAEITEYLIMYNQARRTELRTNPDSVKNTVDLRDRAKLLLEEANKKRIADASKESAKQGEQIAQIIREYHVIHGVKEAPLNAIATMLNDRKIPSPRGGNEKWYASTVKRIIEKNGIQR